MVNALNVLGSTGSVGVQTLRICRHLGIQVTTLTANKNIGLLAQQARTFLPHFAVTADESCYNELKLLLADTTVKVLAGPEAVCEAAAYEAGEMTLNAIVGIAGLRPTLSSLSAGRALALANKESLVTGGSFVMAEAARLNVPILPVDSEHSAIFQCLNAADGNKIEKIILTASGGPFFGRTMAELADARREDALRHPTYSMGAKISIDSATLMNKGLELIEAMWLFDMEPDKIEIVVHPQSVVHSAVEFADGAVIAQMGLPDMALPIQYALTWPGRADSNARRLDLASIGQLDFHRPDMASFTCLAAACRAAHMGGNAPAVINGANEAAVAAFLDNRIGFLQIGACVMAALERVHVPQSDLESVFEADRAAREVVTEHIEIHQRL